MAENLKKQATSGIFWTALQKYSSMVIQFISGIILARLLTPYDYGCIGMLTIFMGLAETFIDGGFGSALIQKKKPTQEDYSTIFFWNIGVAAAMYFILFFTAPAISRFYDIPLLCPVLRVQALVLFIYAFNIIQSNQLRKKMNFKLIAIVTLSTSLISLSVTIFMAFKGFGVWSLVTQNLITAAIPAIVFWFYIKWRPIWKFSKESFKELFGFGFYMFLTHLLNSFSQQIQGLLIGKVYDPSTMGYYSKARTTEKLASTSVSSIMTQVTYPLYSKSQDDKTTLSNMIKRLTATLAYIMFPLMFILLLLAKPIFLLLYSDRWLDSVPYFQILCLSGMGYCLQSVNLQSISAIGKSRTMFRWALLKRIVGLVFVVGGLALYGIKGLLCGAVMNTWFSYFVNIGLVSKHIGYKWWIQIKDLLPMFLSSATIAVICYSLGRFTDLGLYPDAALKLVVFVLLYLGWSIIFKPESYVFVQDTLKNVRSKGNGKK